MDAQLDISSRRPTESLVFVQRCDNDERTCQPFVYIADYWAMSGSGRG